MKKIIFSALLIAAFIVEILLEPYFDGSLITEVTETTVSHVECTLGGLI